MAKFHKLTVKNIRPETDECVSIAFHVPEELKPEFEFTQGQYVTLRTDINGEDIRRSYSICAAPHEGELRVAVKKVPQGKFSTFANEVLAEGDEMQVMTPQGRFFTELKENQQKHYVAFAAGSGITPVMSIMKSVLKVEPQSNFTLFYGNKDAQHIIFKEQIEDLKNVHMQRVRVHHVLSRENPGADLFHGRIDEEKCNSFCNLLLNPQNIDEVFLCGPEPMIKAASNVLEDKGVPTVNIHYELFTSPNQPSAKQHATAKKGAEVKGSVEEGRVKVILDGEETNITVGTDGDNILDAALKAGTDVPFACKGAVCMTCKAKVLKGDVKMDKNYALLDEEVNQGYVLTCQAHPTTDEVVVSFDD